MTRRILNRRPLLCATLMVVLASCSVIDPVAVRHTESCGWQTASTVQSAGVPTTQVTQPSGSLCAAELRNRYLRSVSDRALIETATNVGLLGLVATVATLASLDAISTSEIAATSIGGAALLAAPRLLGSQERDFVYLAGAEAMTCTLDSALPATRLLNDSEFLRELDAIQASVSSDLDALSSIAAAPGGTTTESLAIEEAREAARTALDRSRGLERQLRTVDDRVLNAARGIDVRVTAAIRRDRVSAQEVIEGLTGSVSLVQERVGGITTALAGPQLEAAAVAAENAAADVKDAIEKAKRRVMRLEEFSDEMSAALTPFNSQSLRERCSIDSVEVRPFSVSEDRINLPRPAANTTGSALIHANGGKAPHSAGLTGRVPSDPNSLLVSVEETRDGFARIRVTATPAIEPDRYSLRVREASGREARVVVVVSGARGGSAARGPGGTGTSPDGTAETDPLQVKNNSVVKLQEKLQRLFTCEKKPEVPQQVKDALLDPGANDGIFGGDNSKTRSATNAMLSLLDEPTRWSDLEGDLEAKTTTAVQQAEKLITELCKT